MTKCIPDVYEMYIGGYEPARYVVTNPQDTTIETVYGVYTLGKYILLWSAPPPLRRSVCVREGINARSELG